MKLENEFLLVEIAAQGAEVTRIFNKKDETDVLWEGNWSSGVAILHCFSRM